MGRATKKTSLEVGAAEFKAHCLQLVQEVHDRKRNSITITKRGKPLARVVPVEDTPPLYGCLKSKVKILGDLTAPLDVGWDALSR